MDSAESSFSGSRSILTAPASPPLTPRQPPLSSPSSPPISPLTLSSILSPAMRTTLRRPALGSAASLSFTVVVAPRRNAISVESWDELRPDGKQYSPPEDRSDECPEPGTSCFVCFGHNFNFEVTQIGKREHNHRADLNRSNNWGFDRFHMSIEDILHQDSTALNDNNNSVLSDINMRGFVAILKDENGGKAQLYTAQQLTDLVADLDLSNTSITFVDDDEGERIMQAQSASFTEGADTTCFTNDPTPSLPETRAARLGDGLAQLLRLKNGENIVAQKISSLSTEQQINLAKSFESQVYNPRKHLGLSLPPSTRHERSQHRRLDPAEQDLAEKSLTQRGLAERDLAEKDLTQRVLAERDLAEKGLAEKYLAEQDYYKATSLGRPLYADSQSYASIASFWTRSNAADLQDNQFHRPVYKNSHPYSIMSDRRDNSSHAEQEEDNVFKRPVYKNDVSYSMMPERHGSTSSAGQQDDGSMEPAYTRGLKIRSPTLQTRPHHSRLAKMVDEINNDERSELAARDLDYRTRAHTVHNQPPAAPMGHLLSAEELENLIHRRASLETALSGLNRFGNPTGPRAGAATGTEPGATSLPYSHGQYFGQGDTPQSNRTLETHLSTLSSSIGSRRQSYNSPNPGATSSPYAQGQSLRQGDTPQSHRTMETHLSTLSSSVGPRRQSHNSAGILIGTGRGSWGAGSTVSSALGQGFGPHDTPLSQRTMETHISADSLMSVPKDNLQDRTTRAGILRGELRSDPPSEWNATMSPDWAGSWTSNAIGGYSAAQPAFDNGRGRSYTAGQSTGPGPSGMTPDNGPVHGIQTNVLNPNFGRVNRGVQAEHRGLYQGLNNRSISDSRGRSETLPSAAAGGAGKRTWSSSSSIKMDPLVQARLRNLLAQTADSSLHPRLLRPIGATPESDRGGPPSARSNTWSVSAATGSPFGRDNLSDDTMFRAHQNPAMRSSSLPSEPRYMEGGIWAISSNQAAALMSPDSLLPASQRGNADADHPMLRHGLGYYGEEPRPMGTAMQEWQMDNGVPGPKRDQTHFPSREMFGSSINVSSSSGGLGQGADTSDARRGSLVSYMSSSPPLRYKVGGSGASSGLASGDAGTGHPQSLPALSSTVPANVRDIFKQREHATNAPVRPFRPAKFIVDPAAPGPGMGRGQFMSNPYPKLPSVQPAVPGSNAPILDSYASYESEMAELAGMYQARYPQPVLSNQVMNDQKMSVPHQSHPAYVQPQLYRQAGQPAQPTQPAQPVSSNYRGVRGSVPRGVDTVNGVPPEQNTCVFLMGAPEDVTYAELLGSIRNCGRIFCSHINESDPEKGHLTCAAKIAFFTRVGAERLMMQSFRNEFRIRGYPVRVIWNRNGYTECTIPSATRILLIRGPKKWVNHNTLSQYFQVLFWYNLVRIDELSMEHAAAIAGGGWLESTLGLENLPEEYREMAAMRWEFGSFHAQAQAAKQAIERETAFAGLVKVNYLADPCDLKD